jgi:hypothetical protein
MSTFSLPATSDINPSLAEAESSLDASHLNLFYLFDRKVEEDQLTRFFLFPYYYENDDPKNTKSTSYHHLIPFYFSVCRIYQGLL